MSDLVGNPNCCVVVIVYGSSKGNEVVLLQHASLELPLTHGTVPVFTTPTVGCPG